MSSQSWEPLRYRNLQYDDDDHDAQGDHSIMASHDWEAERIILESP